jgi:conjugative transfer signal peptidase TraF
MLLRLKSRRPLYLAGAALLCILAGRFTFERWAPRLVVNTTGSEPRGVYWLSAPTEKTLQRTTLVAMTVPESFRALIQERHWTRPGIPLLKNVAAVAGDTVCVSDGTLSINGRPVVPVMARDSRGRPLPQLRGCRQLAAGYFLPLSTYVPNSFDGRYMGQQPVTLIQGVAHPLWIF